LEKRLGKKVEWCDIRRAWIGIDLGYNFWFFVPPENYLKIGYVSRCDRRRNP
jgi:hypothetical protein